MYTLDYELYMLGTDLAILFVYIKFINTFFFNTYYCIAYTGQSPAIPPPLPTEQASRPTLASPTLEGPTLASPTLEGKYFIFPKIISVVDKCRETKQNSCCSNKIHLFS